MRTSRAALCLAAAALLAACGAAPAKQYFKLTIPLSRGAAMGAIGRPVCVETPVVDDVYDTYRIIYRVSPYEMKRYPYEFWAEMPGAVVRHALIAYLRRSGAASEAAPCPGSAGDDIILRSHVWAVEEDDTDPRGKARLAMEIVFVDGKTGKILARRSFDETEPMEQKRADGLFAALSAILGRELAAALDELSAALK
jgi:uncharacterized lipoprotein YmbA